MTPETIRAIAALPERNDEPRPGHEPGDFHRYRTECEVCGQPGTLRVSLWPERLDPAAEAPQTPATDPERVKALRPYLVHKRDCELVLGYYAAFGPRPAECTCGLAALREPQRSPWRNMPPEEWDRLAAQPEPARPARRAWVVQGARRSTIGD